MAGATTGEIVHKPIVVEGRLLGQDHDFIGVSNIDALLKKGTKQAKMQIFKRTVILQRGALGGFHSR